MPDYDEEAHATGRATFIYLMYGGLALLVLAAIFAASQGYFMSVERDAVEESRQYAVGVVEDLSDARQRYEEATENIAKYSDSNEQLADAARAQQKGALIDMQATIDKVGFENIPTAYQDFWKEHKDELAE